MDWPHAEPIASERLVLDPITVAYADSMVTVLDDPSLYEFTGGLAPTHDALRIRYAAQVVGHSADGTEGWLNWVVTPGAAGDPVGFVQATVALDSSVLVADVAWVIARGWQGQGIATEAVRAMIGWLRSNGIGHFVAYIHPAHHASMRVARNQGLHPTSVEMEGEIRWES